MQVRFYQDPESGVPHIFDHGVQEREVREVLASPGEDRPGRDGARVALGRTRNGRYLRVIYVPDTDANGAFVITAYDLRGKALAAFRRRMKNRS